MLVVLLTLQMTTPCKGQRFEAHGTITLESLVGTPNRTTLSFSVARDGVLWKIRTTPGSDSHGVPYDEVGYDGTNMFLMERYDVAGSQTNSHLSSKDIEEISTARGRAFQADSPPCLEPNLLLPLWLAYCSGHYLSTLTNNGMLVAPLFSFRSSLGSGRRTDLPAKWTLDQGGFPSRIEWQATGSFVDTDSEGHEEEIHYPPPYDKGFLQAVFEVSRTQPFEGTAIPSQFKITVPGPDYQGGLRAYFTIDAGMDSIRPLLSWSPVPEITAKTLIVDARYIVGSQPRTVVYTSSSKWDSLDEIKQRIADRSLRH